MVEIKHALMRTRRKRLVLLCSHSAFQPRSAKTLGTRPCFRSPRTPSTALRRSASSAGDVERHTDVVAYLQLLHVLTELLHHAGKLVAERHPHSGIRNGAVVQV